MRSFRLAVALLPFVFGVPSSRFTEPPRATKLVWGNMHALLFPDSIEGTLVWLRRREPSGQETRVSEVGFGAFFDPDSLSTWIPYAREFLSRALSDNDSAVTRVSPIITSTSGQTLYFARRKVDGRWTSERFLAFRSRFASSAQYIALADDQGRTFLDSLASVALSTPLLSADEIRDHAYYRSRAPDTLECPRPDIANNRWLRYPEQARMNGIEGDVWARFVITAQGRVRENSLQVYFSDDIEFSRAVRAALPLFRFEPSRRNGQATETGAIMPFTFRLYRSDGPRPPPPRVIERCK